MLRIKGYGEYKDLQQNLRFCLSLLNKLGFEEINIKFFKNYPNKSQGELINSVKLELLKKEILVKDYVEIGKYLIWDIVIEIDFKIKIKGEIIDGFIRIYNNKLSKVYGDIEMDIYPFEDVSNFGDLIVNYKLNKFKEIIENHITKEAGYFKLKFKEAYISVSLGDSYIDPSKKIWIYYSSPALLIIDILSFIKNIKDIEVEEGIRVPSYLNEKYQKIIPQIRPYNNSFLGRELIGNEKFRGKFDDFVKENEVLAKSGSLILSSNDIHKNLNLIREISEKLIFPVMSKVTGETQFRDIINKTL